MSNLFINNERAIRLVLFLGILVAMAVWEMRAPARISSFSKSARWVNNLGLVAFNAVVLRVFFSAAALGMAGLAEARGWGLLDHFTVGIWFAVPIALIAMDVVIWLQHVMVHLIPALWRFHRVHHADLWSG